MATPYIGEIRLFGFSFAPQGWAHCNGQLMPTQDNQALFSLLGTTYGGDGINTYGLPNLQSRVMVSQGTSSTGNTWVLGEQTGTEAVSLSVNQIPSHNHQLAIFESSTNRTGTPSNAVGLSNPTQSRVYKLNGVADGLMSAQMITGSGGGLPHSNMSRVLTINPCISLFGIFPARN
jgi:microcystin-dependent protein